ncbi:MAG TPA: histidine phosphatase family protein [Enhygromyxa sp.]|nr:histidine phosphatase family protein [Enhygromyxa sp.]
MLFRRRFLAALGLASLTAAACGPSCSCDAPMPEAGTVVVYIVRHAEKQPVPEHASEAERKDPPLSQLGQLRAIGLAEDIPVREIEAVYVTNTKRCRDTASAVLALNGVKPIIYPPKDVLGLAERIRRRRGQSVLVVGHSNTIPPLIAELGVDELVLIPEDQYGDLWVVTLTGDKATLEVRRYGESIERFDPGR